jgi:putative ABC transport system ATP-binding protein
VDSTAHPTAGTSGTPQPAAPAVRARGLTKVYGRGEATVHALAGVDVDFAAGAFTAIMGPSGSGKSTLMHVLAGLDAATSGSAFLGGTDVTTLGDDALTRLRRDRVGFVFQSFNLLPMFTAEQNILLPLELAGASVDRAWFDTLVSTLGLGRRLTHRPAELSGGQQQRVAIARALIAKPEVVFADEPTGNLDSRSGAEVLSFLRRSVRELGRTIIMVTHDPTAAAYADRVVLLADGRIAGEILDPTPEAVLTGLDALRQLESTEQTPVGA